MPTRLVMFTGAEPRSNHCMSHWFNMPMRGCRNRVHPMAVKKPGMNTPSVATV
jgi:hypothetical protein